MTGSVGLRCALQKSISDNDYCSNTGVGGWGVGGGGGRGQCLTVHIKMHLNELMVCEREKHPQNEQSLFF